MFVGSRSSHDVTTVTCYLLYLIYITYIYIYLYIPYIPYIYLVIYVVTCDLTTVTYSDDYVTCSYLPKPWHDRLA